MILTERLLLILLLLTYLLFIHTNTLIFYFCKCTIHAESIEIEREKKPTNIYDSQQLHAIIFTRHI